MIVCALSSACTSYCVLKWISFPNIHDFPDLLNSLASVSMCVCALYTISNLNHCLLLHKA